MFSLSLILAMGSVGGAAATASPVVKLTQAQITTMVTKLCTDEATSTVNATTCEAGDKKLQGNPGGTWKYCEFTGGKCIAKSTHPVTTNDEANTLFNGAATGAGAHSCKAKAADKATCQAVPTALKKDYEQVVTGTTKWKVTNSDAKCMMTVDKTDMKKGKESICTTKAFASVPNPCLWNDAAGVAAADKCVSRIKIDTTGDCTYPTFAECKKKTSSAARSTTALFGAAVTSFIAFMLA